MFGCFYKNELENKMPGMTIENIAAACEGTFVGDRDLVTKEIAGAVTDSRQVQKDYLFIPIKGARVDGHDFIPQVFEKGSAFGSCTAGRDGTLYSGKFHNRSDEKNCSFLPDTVIL